MPRLISDKTKCKECGACEKTLTGFKTQYDGDIFISWATMRDSILAQESVKYIREHCPEGAIELRRS